MSSLPNKVGPFNISLEDNYLSSIKIECSDLQGYIVQQAIVSLDLNLLWGAGFKQSVVSSASSDITIGGKKTISRMYLLAAVKDGHSAMRDVITETTVSVMRAMFALQLAKVVYRGKEGVNRRFKPIQF